MSAFLAKVLGANYKTTVSAIGTAIFATITFFAQLSYDQGPIALVVPVKYKRTVTLIAGLCTLALWIWNGIAQKSKEVTGGSVMQTMAGNIVPPESKPPLVETTKSVSVTTP